MNRRSRIDALGERADVDGCRPDALVPQHDDIVPLAADVAVPHRTSRERLEEGRHLALHGLLAGLVQRHPLGHHAARVEALLDELEVLGRIERRRAPYPRMDRVRGDDVEGLARGGDEVTRIIENELDPRIVDHVVVFFGEVHSGALRHQRFDLADDDTLDARVENKRARGNAGTEADDEH